MATTIRAVAEAAGVSITTVSFVLNNKRPQVEAIPRETRDRVKACAHELGYRKNQAAASLRTGQSVWIGTVMQPRRDESEAWTFAPYELSLLSGVQSALAEYGYFTVLGTRTPGEPAREVDAINSLISSGIGGLILRCPSEAVVELAEELIEDELPVVAVFPEREEDLYPNTIDMDNFRAGQIAGEIFVEEERKTVMCVSAKKPRDSDIDRRAGFRDVLRREYGTDPIEYQLVDATDRELLSELVDLIRKHKPDAIMAPEAGTSFLLTFAAEVLDLDVPEDLSIIGFDCYSFLSARDHRISGIGTSWWDAGRAAAQGILGMLRHRTNRMEPKKLAPRFVLGDTTKLKTAGEDSVTWLL